MDRQNIELWRIKLAVESAIGAGRSAVALPAASRRRFSFLRHPMRIPLKTGHACPLHAFAAWAAAFAGRKTAGIFRRRIRSTMICVPRNLFFMKPDRLQTLQLTYC